MELYIKDKLFSLRRKASVYDENGNTYFYIGGKMFSPTRKKSVYDINGEKLYTVRNKFFHILPKAYIYDSEGEKILKIKKRFSFRQSFTIVNYKDEIKIDGDFIGWHFDVWKNGVLIGNITKKIWALTDTFILTINDDEDAALFVAIIACIDNIFDQHNR